VESDESPRRLSMSRNSELIDKVLPCVQRLWEIIREMSEEVGISISLCHSIVTQDLGMRGVAAKFVPNC